MKNRRAYLDYNATAPLRPQARAALLAALDEIGNASSVHGEGRRARMVLEEARAAVARLVGAVAKSVIFTSGATEANVTVFRQPRWKQIAVSAVEHPSVLEAARASDASFSILPVEGNGRVSLAALDAWLADTSATEGERLVSVQWANNETGVIQPIGEIAEGVAAAGARLHVDAVQAAGRVPIDLQALEVSFLTVSSHKIGGPQGIGALIQGPGGEIRAPLIVGGGQENRLRAGTENVAAAAGFGAAALAAAAEAAEPHPVSDLRDELERRACEIAAEAIVVGMGAPRLPNTSCLALPGRKAETLVIGFDLAGVALSSGAACSSGKVGRSHVLEAMGLPESLANAAVRISLGWATKPEDIDDFTAALSPLMNHARPAVPVA